VKIFKDRVEQFQIIAQLHTV